MARPFSCRFPSLSRQRQTELIAHVAVIIVVQLVQNVLHIGLAGLLKVALGVGTGVKARIAVADVCPHPHRQGGAADGGAEGGIVEAEIASVPSRETVVQVGDVAPQPVIQGTEIHNILRFSPRIPRRSRESEIFV